MSLLVGLGGMMMNDGFVGLLFFLSFPVFRFLDAVWGGSGYRS